ncbi:SDR family oxidoreductase [Salinicoccus sp. ID82-1]|uniref:SDR family oxidoreductase n=1 Tax=Salinicoccus sp. ID82-1 TaxID=2820269 RepID=UPI001F42C1C7|nr:SDR family oxidoreductase [Salinicoccus sp. ID82-1]MCG1010754.1 SDR family oxidoreductase [Salinicoccus sp. ID82-1]
MKVAIIGANGKVGSRLGQLLAERGDEPVGYIRKKEQAPDLEALGMKTNVADLVETDVAEYASMLEGTDVLVFAAGAGGAGVDATKAVDGEGVSKMITAAENAGVKRFLLVSAFPDAWRDKDMPDSFEFYMKMKRKADAGLAKSSLDWTILRPGTLTDDPGTGKVKLGPVIPYGQVSRDDVAAVLAELINNDETARLVLELTEGATPIQEAVADQNRPLQ